MRRTHLTIILISVLSLWGCKEEVDVSNRYVFRDHTVYSYLQNHEQFSEFADILNHVKVSQFVDANKTYYLRMKSVLDSDTKEFYMDHLEWCAKEVFDNPMEPEDIW